MDMKEKSEKIHIKFTGGNKTTHSKKKERINSKEDEPVREQEAESLIRSDR